MLLEHIGKETALFLNRNFCPYVHRLSTRYARQLAYGVQGRGRGAVCLVFGKDLYNYSSLFHAVQGVCRVLADVGPTACLIEYPIATSQARASPTPAFGGGPAT